MPETKKPASSEESGASALSRRDFIAATAATAATGMVLGAGQPAAAAPQATLAFKPENAHTQGTTRKSTRGLLLGLYSRS